MPIDRPPRFAYPTPHFDVVAAELETDREIRLPFSSVNGFFSPTLNAGKQINIPTNASDPLNLLQGPIPLPADQAPQSMRPVFNLHQYPNAFGNAYQPPRPLLNVMPNLGPLPLPPAPLALGTPTNPNPHLDGAVATRGIPAPPQLHIRNVYGPPVDVHWGEQRRLPWAPFAPPNVAPHPPPPPAPYLPPPAPTSAAAPTPPMGAAAAARPSSAPAPPTPIAPTPTLWSRATRRLTATARPAWAKAPPPQRSRRPSRDTRDTRAARKERKSLRRAPPSTRGPPHAACDSDASGLPPSFVARRPADHRGDERTARAAAGGPARAVSPSRRTATRPRAPPPPPRESRNSHESVAQGPHTAREGRRDRAAPSRRPAPPSSSRAGHLPPPPGAPSSRRAGSPPSSPRPVRSPLQTDVFANAAEVSLAAAHGFDSPSPLDSSRAARARAAVSESPRKHRRELEDTLAP